jgi:hypothetical protein
MNPTGEALNEGGATNGPRNTDLKLAKKQY